MTNFLKKRARISAIFLLTSLIIAYIFIDWRAFKYNGEIGAFIILLVCFYNFRKKAIKQRPTPTPALAIVMSAGVFVSDFFHIIPVKNALVVHFVQLFVICIFLLWLFFIFSYTKTIFKKTFYLQHMSSILNSFGMGTWIAGASVCSMGLIMYLPEWKMAAYLIISVNTLLWLMLIGLYIRNLVKLVKEEHLLLNGIVLLSTVSTMSLAIDYSLVPNLHTYWSLLFLLICIGLLFYVAFMILIIRSLFREKWMLTDDFQNANCIFHGALSITGLAGIMCGVFSSAIAWGLWFFVLFIFIIVEALEVARAVKRIKHYGMTRALGTYNVSQWARNFTFSMLLAFTFKLPTKSLAGLELILLKGFVVGLFIAVLFLLLYEGFLFFKDQTFLLGQDCDEDVKKGLTLP